jgi:hypothetical protein
MGRLFHCSETHHFEKGELADMKKFTFFMVLFAFLLCIAGPASAIVVTVEDNLADDMMVTQGQTVTGTFDINPPVLPDDGNYNLPYDIQSAVASFEFTDDGDREQTGSTTTTVYRNWNTHNGSRWMTRTTVDYFFDAEEEVQLDIGTQVSTDGTSWYELEVVRSDTTATDTSRHQHSYTYQCNEDIWGNYDLCTGYYTHYVHTTRRYINNDETQGYSGGLTIDIALDATNLADLSLDGAIDFTVQGTTGDIIFNRGVLTAEVAANPVPEPGTFVLFGVGFIGLAGLARRKRV